MCEFDGTCGKGDRKGGDGGPDVYRREATHRFEQRVDATRELGLPTPCGEGKREIARLEMVFGESRQAAGVVKGSGGAGDDTGVAGEFALERETTFDEEKRGVEREEGKSDLLREVDPVVATAKVFALMKDNLVQLGFSEPVEESLRDEEARREEANNAG